MDMAFPGREHANPREASAAVNIASFAQDVVLALSRLLHRQAMTERDRRALNRCRALIERLDAREVTLRRPSERSLAADAKTVAVFRAARFARPHRDDLHQTMEVLDRALGGQLEESDLERLSELRETFLSVGRLNLQSMTKHESQDGATSGWTPLIASSLS
jgi:hypothetical protein